MSGVLSRPFSRLTGTHLGEVLSGAALAFMLRGFGAAAALLFNACIARLLGAEGAGLYFLALSITMIASVVARTGFDNTLLRSVAAQAAKLQWGRVKGTHVAVMRMALVNSAALATLFFFFAPWIAEAIFNNPDLGPPLRAMSFGIVTISFMTLSAEALRGIKKIGYSIAVSGVFYPVLGLGCIWMLAPLGAVGAGLSYVLATGGATLAGLWFWHRAMARHPAPMRPVARAPIRTASRPLFAMSLLNSAVLPWAPLLLLGIFGTVIESGVFGAAARMATLLSFVVMAANTILAPKFAEFAASGATATAGRLARQSALLTALISAPMVVLFITSGDWVMSIFGAEFRSGGRVLAILALGQAVNILTGPVGFLLVMSGHGRDARNAAILAACALTIVGLVLIPAYGMEGAAVASMIGLSTDKLAALWLAWKRLGVLGCAWPNWKRLRERGQ